MQLRQFITSAVVAGVLLAGQQLYSGISPSQYVDIVAHSSARGLGYGMGGSIDWRLGSAIWDEVQLPFRVIYGAEVSNGKQIMQHRKIEQKNGSEKSSSVEPVFKKAPVSTDTGTADKPLFSKTAAAA